eukprot:jgi/Tetstr1/421454/TSEL_012403.t1
MAATHSGAAAVGRSETTASVAAADGPEPARQPDAASALPDRKDDAGIAPDASIDVEPERSLLRVMRGGCEEDEGGSLLLAEGSEDSERGAAACRGVRERPGLATYLALCRASASRVWPAYLGSIMEFYELMVYINAGPALSHNFFSRRGGDELWQSLGVWVGHACTFLVRPLGGFLFGWVADTFGRRRSMLATIVGMSAATTLIGCLPTGERLGAAPPCVLLLLKAVQGLFVSGEGPAAVVYSIERSSKETVALTGTSLFASAVYCGILLASTVTFLAAACMSDAAYLSHGWRIPFLTAAPLGLAIVALRHQMPETEAFQREAEQRREERGNKPGIKSVSDSGARLTRQWRPILFGLLAIAPNPAAAYGGLLFFPTFLTSAAGLYSVAAGASLSAAGTLVGIVASPVAGALADAFGLDALILAGAALVALCAVPLWLMAVSSLGLAFLSVALFACVLAAQGGVYASYLADMFPTQDRAAGLGTAYNIAFAVFGGLTPIAESLLWAADGARCAGCSARLTNTLPSVCLVAVGAVGTLAAAHVRRLKRRGVIASHIVRPASETGERSALAMVRL